MEDTWSNSYPCSPVLLVAIRRRLRGERKTGFPAPLFTRYARRFGFTVACFLSPQMQVVAGINEPIKRGGDPEIWYLSKAGVQAELANAEELRLTAWAETTRKILTEWPSLDDEANLGSSAFYT